MKVIKIFLVFSFGLWAEFKLDIPNDINTSQLENIVKNGWNDSNVTLNNWIVSNAERVMPEILEKINKPFEVKKTTKENMFPMPKINLGRMDYTFIVSYSKYLEFNDNIYKSVALNIEILKGLKNIEDTSMLSVIYSLVVEGIVRDGFSQLLSGNKNFENKLFVFKQISSLLTLDTSAFL